MAFDPRTEAVDLVGTPYSFEYTSAPTEGTVRYVFQHGSAVSEGSARDLISLGRSALQAGTAVWSSGMKFGVWVQTGGDNTPAHVVDHRYAGRETFCGQAFNPDSAFDARPSAQRCSECAAFIATRGWKL